MKPVLIALGLVVLYVLASWCRRDTTEDDRPTAAWLADWRTLVDARARYADDLAAGRNPEWTVPVQDDRLITERMSTVALDCAVPPEIAEAR
ncbi:hypothetical protein [Saccharothrix sp. NRRL B-16314]|uniref:hypothetical protein n=1 Tax=Saccharothrix sp. NRRL B-16314 TaxID=1463825 RepID=UPI000B135AFD|nr:hypothetical protein [Saccharothrix sp. NRRL B-16314]